MEAIVWFWAAAATMVACGVLSVVVIVAGVRRAQSEVALLGLSLFAVSAMGTSLGLSGTPIGGGAPAAAWAGALAMPLAVICSVPVLRPGHRLARRIGARIRLTVTTSGLAIAALAAFLVGSSAAPSTPVRAGLAIVGAVGGASLAARQVRLHRLTGNAAAPAVAAAILLVTGSTLLGGFVTPGSAGAWAVLVVENAGVLGAGYAALVGYRTGRGITEVLGPLVSVEPLAALEVGLTPEVHAFVAALERKDPVTRHHVVRTSALAMRVAVRSGLDAPTVRAVAIGALLHDIGKLVIPSEIIGKPGGLTDEEYATIKTHPEQGERLLQRSPGLAPAAPYVRGHHERPDGRGYPDGLVGDEVLLAVNLVSVADAWDAMTNTRQYRTGMSPARAREILREGAGTQWRADAVEFLLAEVRSNGVVDERPLGGLGRPTETADADLFAGCPCDDALPALAVPPERAPVERGMARHRAGFPAM